LVFQAMARVAIFNRCSRSVSNWPTRQKDRAGIRRRSDHNSQWAAQNVGNAMHDTLRRVRIGQAGGQLVGNAKAAFNLEQRQHAAIRGELAAVEAGEDGLAGYL
jgi:hypothetical protein